MPSPASSSASPRASVSGLAAPTPEPTMLAFSSSIAPEPARHDVGRHARLARLTTVVAYAGFLLLLARAGLCREPSLGDGFSPAPLDAATFIPARVA